MNNAMNQPSSSRFPTNDYYIYEWYKMFLLNNVSFIALVSVQVNFIGAAHCNSKNEKEKQYLQQHSLRPCSDERQNGFKLFNTKTK